MLETMQAGAAGGLAVAGAARARRVWTAGDFDLIAQGFAEDAARFVTRLDLAAGERVLDVACGTGNLALPAARLGAEVTGLDIAPNLLATARSRAADAARPGGGALMADGPTRYRSGAVPSIRIHASWPSP